MCPFTARDCQSSAPLHIPQPRSTEILSIPLQQTAKLLSDGCSLTQEEDALIRAVMDPDQAAASYSPIISDPIKSISDATPILNAPGAYWNLYLGLLRKYPLKMLEAWIDQTKGYWNGGYSYWLFPAPYENSLGIRVSPPVPAAHSLFTAYERLFEDSPILCLTVCIGASVWLFLACQCVGILRKDRALCFLTVPVLITIGLLLIGTPVFCKFRYAYSAFCTLPFLLAVTFGVD